MRRLVLALFALALAVPAAAQTSAPPAEAPAESPMPPPGPSVGILNFDTLIAAPPKGLASWHAKNTQLENEFRPKRAEIDQIVKAAQAAEEQAAKAADPAARQAATARVARLKADSQRKVQEGVAQYAKRQQELIGPLFAPLQAAVKAFAAERKLTDLRFLEGPQAAEAEAKGYTDVTPAFIAWQRAHGGG